MRTPLLLELSADAISNRIAVDGVGGALTYAELHQRARRLAAVLAAMPVKKVGFLGANTHAFPISFFASALAGLPFAPLNYRLPDDALRRLVARLAPCTVLADADMAPRLRGLDAVPVLIHDPLNADGPPSVHAPGSAGPGHAATGAAAPGDIAEESEVAVLLFTSGTSGEPKAAVLKHENLTSYVMQTVEFLSAPDDEATLVSVPPYHVAAVSSLISSVYAGRRIVQLESFSPEAWIEMVSRFAVTHAMVVPTMLGRILDVIEARALALPSLRAIAYGGGRMPLSTIGRALRLLPQVEFTNAYGLTETSSTISVLGPEEHGAARRGDADALRRLNSVGKPLASVSVEIRDAAQRPVAVGQPGEIWVRGDQVSGEYVGVSAKDPEGWFPTKDLGWFDSAGYLFIDGRLDDVIVRGGENISPGEIEDTLRQHPAILDIAVVGVADEEWGERIVAFAVLRDPAAASADDLRRWVKERLRSTKAPQDVLFRAELPYNETGKLLRRVLRDEFNSPKA